MNLHTAGGAKRQYTKINNAMSQDLRFSHKNPVVFQHVFDSRPTYREFFAPVFWPRATF